MLVKDVDLGMPIGMEWTVIGPVKISRSRRAEAIQLMASSILTKRPVDVAICNANTILMAMDDADFARALDTMVLFNDGVGTNIASFVMTGRRFPENLNGTDLVPEFLERVGMPLRIYLLGARKETVAAARAHIERTYPTHTVVGARDGYFSLAEEEQICQDISDTRPDLLLVAMGNPLQERFVLRNRHRLNVGATIGVGALFDYMAGRVTRAPKPLRDLGLEWLFRFVREPRRLFRRYAIGIPRFLFAVLKLWFQSR